MESQSVFLKAMEIYMYKLDKKNAPVEVICWFFSDVENHKETPASVEKMEVDDEEDEERKTTIRMCKTGALNFTNLYYSTCSTLLYVCWQFKIFGNLSAVLKWISDGLGRMFTSTTPELFFILPVVSNMLMYM